jgi:hypothetical protein
MIGIGRNRARKIGGRRRANGARRLSMENLEPRLALTWAGVPPTAIAPPAGASAVTLVSNDASGSATIATTEVDYYSFTATATGTYTISATTPSSSVDTVLGVFSSTGQRLTYNDDISYPSNTDSRVTISLTAGTRYYVGLTNYTSSSRGAYSWSIDGPAVTSTPTDDAYENNDTFASAYNLGTLTSTRTVSSLVMADSADWFRFTTSATGTTSNTISVTFQNSQGNLQLALYNSSGTLLATSAGTGNTETITLNGRAAGTYYIDVFGNSGATNPNYSLSIVAPTTTSTPTTGGFQITLSMSGLTASQQAIFQQAAARWSQVITGDLPNATYRGTAVDDLLISASAISIDGVNGVLGQAGPDAFRSGSDLPYHGIMQFDSADLASMENSGLLFSVVLHEMGHVLGIGTIWEDLGLLSGAGGSNPTFTGANATAAYNQLFGTSARGVPVENTGGPGTADGHWRESILTNELMTGWVNGTTTLPLSRITIGSLADIGYTVNYAAADSFTPSSSSLTAARQAASSSLSSSRFAGLSAFASEVFGATGSISTLDTSVAPSVLEPRRVQSLAAIAQTAVESRAADAAMAESWRSPQETLHFQTALPDSDAATEVDDIWGELASDFTFWRDLEAATLA